LNTSPKYCESCGSQLPPEVKFCVQCGAPVPEEQIDPADQSHDPSGQSYEPSVQAYEPPIQAYEPIPVQPYTPLPTPPAPTNPPTQPMQAAPPPKKKSNLPCLLISGIVILGVLCLVILGAGAYFYYNTTSSIGSISETQVVVEPLPSEAIPLPPTEAAGASPTIEPPIASPTDFQPSTEAVQQPTEEIPFATVPASGSGQTEPFTNAFSIFDPFNDNQFGWEIDSASDLTTNVENGAYTMYTNQTSTYFWVYPPVDFDPIVIEFDAWVDPATSTQDFGTYGVACNLQDSNNFTYVEVDPNDGTFYFAKFVDDEEISLRDEDWTESASMLIGAGEINHVLVECYPTSISLYINNNFEDSVNLDPPATSGRSGLLIGTWDTMDSNGYKLFFDNFYGYIPQQ